MMTEYHATPLANPANRKHHLLAHARALLPVAVLAGLIRPGSDRAYAASGNWAVDNAGNWSSGANWSTNPIVPGTAAGDVIGFTNNIGANRTITIDTTSRTAGVVNFGDSNSTHGFTLAASGGASLILDNGGLGAQLNKSVSTVTDAITAPISLIDAGGLTVTTTTGQLNITGGLNNNGNTLTFDGAGVTSFAATSNVISGAGGIVKNGSGTLILGAGGTTPAHSYTGTTVVNAGTLMVFGNKTAGNFTLNNGMLTDYFQQTTVFSGGLGSGNNQIQIFGNSGFGGGNGDSTWRIGTSGSVLTWGSAFFNPTTLKFLSPADNMGPTIYGRVTLDNGIDLNGAARTIDVLAATGPNALTSSSGRINGVISGAGGSLVKTGGGTLVLAGNNTYDGSTTISAGQLTANSSAALGNASATNTLIFDGGSLRAGGAITSPATRPVSLNSTATIDTNNFAVRFDGAISGAGGLIKNGANSLTLAGAVSYSGPTTVNTGSLNLINQSALYNGNTADWTAANLNFKGGSTLGLNVDSAGTAGFTAANLGTLLGNISVANTTSAGLQSGVNLVLDTATATGGTFTPSSAITDSTGAFGGRVSLTKQGSGTLVLNQANTYSGTTVISGGTLQLDAGGALSTAPLHVNGGTLAVNRTGTITQGTNLATIIGGTGSLANVGSGTLALNAPTFHTGNTTATAGNIALSHERAIQNSALDTTGAGSVTLSGVTAPVFGGLSNSGSARNLASVIDASYGSVTGITLNPQSGASYTYAGVIANGAAGMTLTKTGAGTQILTGGNTYSGTTYLNGGTLTLATSGGSISGTAAIQFNGGTLQYNSPAPNSVTTAIPDGAPIIVNSSSTLGVTATVAGGASNNEIIGAVTLNAGQMNFNWTNGGSSGTLMTLSGLSRSGTATANFNAGFSTSSSRWKQTGAGTTPAGQIIGPWYTTGGTGANFASTDYAVYSSDFISPAGIAASAENTWTTAANAYTLANANGSAANGRLTATRNVTALRNTTAGGGTITVNTTTDFVTMTGSTFADGDVIVLGNTGGGLTTGVPYYVRDSGGAGVGTFKLATSSGGTAIDITGANTSNLNAGITLPSGSNLGTFGILNGSAFPLGIGGSGGAVTLPTTAAGNLHVTAGAGAISIGAPVNNNTGALTLVKNGSNTLTLGSTASTYSGGTVINAGTVSISNNLNLGVAGTGITFNGNGTLQSNVDTTLVDLGTRPIDLNNGSIATITGTSRNNFAIGGAVTGTGGVILTHGSFWGKAALSSTANTFSGPLTVTSPSPGDDGNSVFSINSLADGAGYGAITLNNGSNDGDLIGLDYGTGGANGAGGGGAIAPLVLNNRQIVLATSGNNVFNNSSAQPVTINTDIGFSGTGARAMRFGVLGRAGSGVSTFAGKLTDNAGGAFTPTFGGGTWVLSGANTYTGKTTINGGTLSITSIQNAGSNTGNALGTPAAGANSVIDLASAGNATLKYTGTAPGGHSSDRVVNLTTTSGGTYTLDASGTGTFTLSGGVTSAATSGTPILSLNGTGRGAIGVIANGTVPTNLHKNGAGTWSLIGANTYTGSTTVNSGTLALGPGGSVPNTSTLTVNGATSAFDLGANQSDTVSTVTLQNGASILGTGSSTLTSTVAFNLHSGTVSAILGGAGIGVNKTTTGTVTLSGINTYSGDTSITGGGTLALVHPSSSNNIGASAVINVAASNFLNVTGLNGGSLSLANGQTLKGGGTVTGGLVIGTGAKLAPGASPGTLSTVGAVTYAPGGTYVWEVNNATGTKGVDPGWDWHNITGALNITGTVATPYTIDITGLNTGNALGTVANWNPLTSRTWIIATASGGITGFSTSAFSLNTANFFSNNAANSLGAAAFSLTQSGNDLVLNFSGSGTASSYWDTNGATGGAGASPSGTWTNTGGLFSYSTVGTQATGNWVANNIAVFAAGADAGTYTVTIGAGGVSAGGIVVEDGAMTLGGNALTLTGATPAVTVNAPQPLTLNAPVLGTAGLTKLGAGVATLAGANTYTGSTTLTAGRVQLGGAPVGSVGAITSSEIGRGTLVFNGGALSSANTSARTVLNPVFFTGNGTIGDATNNGAVNFSDAVDLGSATRTITVAANSQARFNQAISGASGVGLVVRGDGELVPNAVNTYDGTTTIGGGVGLTGTIRVESGNELSLGANPAAFNQNQLRLNGGTLRVATADLTIDDSNRGLSVGSGGGTFDVDANRTLTLSTPATFEAASVGSTFFKTGTGTFNLSAAANYNALRVEAGVYRQSAGTTAVSESGGTGLRVASGAVYDLAGGVLRTDRIQEIAGGTFTWGAGRLTAYTSNDTEGTVDFSSSVAPGSPVVSVGHTVSISATSVETTAGSILQAHGSPTLYANLGTRFNNYAFSGILNLSAGGDILEVDLNPALLRPTAAYAEFGSLPLVYADSILGVFNQFNGVTADALPFDQFLGTYNTLLPPTQMPANSWYLEYAKNVVNPTATANPATNGTGTFDVIYFHYNFGANSVNVPEPATFPLVAAGVFALRTIRRRLSATRETTGTPSPVRDASRKRRTRPGRGY